MGRGVRRGGGEEGLRSPRSRCVSAKGPFPRAFSPSLASFSLFLIRLFRLFLFLLFVSIFSLSFPNIHSLFLLPVFFFLSLVALSLSPFFLSRLYFINTHTHRNAHIFVHTRTQTHAKHEPQAPLTIKIQDQHDHTATNNTNVIIAHLLILTAISTTKNKRRFHNTPPSS